ncbi:hypothetical protein GCM10023195_29500 [Actinoallomurus liliacearum]|uniref:Uncharacterized protein n=1 Tax=Actinoallomurus liliacearum TaxID=1080073 RepID=A0ABP8TKL5_9ACTN
MTPGPPTGENHQVWRVLSFQDVLAAHADCDHPIKPLVALPDLEDFPGVRLRLQ